MTRQIIINSTAQEARVAVMENARLSEIFVERKRGQGIVGSVYKGRVMRVLPGMQAAFVDIGLPKAAYLHVSDVFAPADEEDGPVHDALPPDAADTAVHPTGGLTPPPPRGAEARA